MHADCAAFLHFENDTKSALLKTFCRRHQHLDAHFLYAFKVATCGGGAGGWSLIECNCELYMAFNGE